MSFPTTSVLDSFTGANTSPLTGNWTSYATGYFGASHGLQRLSNACTSEATGAQGAAYWNPATYTDSEVYVTITALPADGHVIELWMRAGLVSGNQSNPFGYRILYTYSAGGTDTVKIYRQDNGGANALLSTINQDYASSDKIGASIVGTVITVYRYTAAAWGSVGTYDTSGDGTKFSSAGSLVLSAGDTTVTLDDFGGGTYVPAAASSGGFFGIF